MTSSANTNAADVNAVNNKSVNDNSDKATEARIHDIRNGTILALGNIVVALLLLAGVWSLYEGLGTNFRILEYPALAAYGIPIGLLLVCLALATAQFWVFEWDRRGSDPRPVGAPLGTPPGPRPGKVPQMRFVPPAMSSANENRTPDENRKPNENSTPGSAASSSARHKSAA